MGKSIQIKSKRIKSVSYAKWGYIFIAPFFLIYIFWSLFPQLLTIYYSFFEYRQKGLEIIGPNFVGLANYKALLKPDNFGDIAILKYAGNTMLMWVLGAVPQFAIALLLAVWFTNVRLNIKGQGFFKTIMYMPNLIMASAFAMLFVTLFSPIGPVNQILQSAGILDEAISFMDKPIYMRGLVALINFLMWFGNTMIVLMAGIMGIDQSYFEAAQIDGASSTKVFFKVTLPLLMPIITYSVITALIGGINMFDVPQLMTNGGGATIDKTRTLIMYLQSSFSTSKNYGAGGAISVFIFLVAGILSAIVFKILVAQYTDKVPGESRKKKGGKQA